MPGHVAVGGEADPDGDLGQRRPAGMEQFLGPVHAPLDDVAMRRNAGAGPERLSEMRRAETGEPGEFCQADVFGEMGFDIIDNPLELMWRQAAGDRLHRSPAAIAVVQMDNERRRQVLHIEASGRPAATRVKRQHAYVRAYLRCDRGEKGDVALHAVIDRVAKEIDDRRPPSPTSVRRWARRFFEREGDARHLVGVQAFSLEREKQLHPLVIKAMKRVIGRFYLSRKKNSMDVCYGFLPDELERIRRKYPQLADRLVEPSRATFWRQIQKVPAYIRVLRREGKQAAYRRFIIKGKGIQATRPLQIVICDSKVIDVL
jgi:hypothetical protein